MRVVMSIVVVIVFVELGAAIRGQCKRDQLLMGVVASIVFVLVIAALGIVRQTADGVIGSYDPGGAIGGDVRHRRLASRSR
jgi:hypothetical protein